MPAIGRVCDQEQELDILKDEFEDGEPCAGIHLLFAQCEQNPEHAMQNGLVLFQQVLLMATATTPSLTGSASPECDMDSIMELSLTAMFRDHATYLLSALNPEPAEEPEAPEAALDSEFDLGTTNSAILAETTHDAESFLLENSVSEKDQLSSKA